MSDTTLKQQKRKVSIRRNLLKAFRRHWQFYLLIIPPVLYFIIFKYIPMVNSVIAFKDYNVVEGIWGSEWAGLKYFKLFFDNPNFWPLVKNTFILSLYTLAVGFPIPILLALMLNEIRQGVFKRSVQMVTYAPYFISTVVIVSMLTLILSPRLGIVNDLLGVFGVDSINFLGEQSMFRSVYVWSDVWQHTGYNAIIYIAALAGVNP